jgi:hypothetical protein
MCGQCDSSVDVMLAWTLWFCCLTIEKKKSKIYCTSVPITRDLKWLKDKSKDLYDFLIPHEAIVSFLNKKPEIHH